MNRNQNTPVLLSAGLRSTGFAALICLALMGCKPEEIKQYKVAKIQATTSQAAAPQLDAPLRYVAPEGWAALPAGGMRQAAFKTPGPGEFTVVSLPGQAGDLKGNVNRWRGQVDLPPVQDDSEYLKDLKPLKVDDRPAVALELASPDGQKAMRVVLMEALGKSWFFKLTGTQQSVQAQTEAFDTFMRSIQFNAPPSLERKADAAMAPGPNAATTDQQAMQNIPVPVAESNTRLLYDLPASWQEKEATSMRVASFGVPNRQGQDGDISVVTLAGDGGGLLQNANRWRRQLEMAPTDSEDLKNAVKDLQIDGQPAYFMKLFTGLDGDGMLVALTERDQQTWFIKMTGPSQLIEAQEANFLDFLKSLRFEEKGKVS